MNKIINKIKKAISGYETKAQMKLRYEKELAFANGRYYNPIQIPKISDATQLRARAQIPSYNSPPTEFLKRQMCRDMAEHLMDYIEFDIEDSPDRMDKILVGRIWIVNKK